MPPGTGSGHAQSRRTARQACAFLDEDVGSGYVHVLWELWAAELADEALAERWRSAIGGWRALLESVKRPDVSLGSSCAEGPAAGVYADFANVRVS